MIVYKVPNFPSFFTNIFLRFQPVYNPYSFGAYAARARRTCFRQKINHQVAVEFLFPKSYYLIALYQRIVELWCHAKNFPNAPCTWTRDVFSLLLRVVNIPILEIYTCKHFLYCFIFYEILKSTLMLHFLAFHWQSFWREQSENSYENHL